MLGWRSCRTNLGQPRYYKGLPVSYTPLCGFGGFEGVVPFAVEFVSAENVVGCEGVHFGVADCDAGGVNAVVEFGVYFQPSLGGRGADEIDDDLVAGEGASTPVHGDVVEQSVFDLVPFAGPGWQVADRDVQPGFPARAASPIFHTRSR